MGKETQVFGVVAGGIFAFSDPERFAAETKQLPDGRYLVTLTEIRQQRAIDSNKFYWGTIVKLIGEASGHTKEEVHEHLGVIFRLQPDDTIKSTTQMDDKEFDEYCERCMVLGAEFHGIVWPERPLTELHEAKR